MLFGSSMAATNPDCGGGPEPYRLVQCVSFIHKKEAFRRNMKDQLMNMGFEYYDVSNAQKNTNGY